MRDALRRFKADVFQVLGHPTRIHIVECLRDRELSVGALLERISVEPANLSQHLSVLRSKQLVTSRKEGNQVFYALRDPALVDDHWKNRNVGDVVDVTLGGKLDATRGQPLHVSARVLDKRSAHGMGAWSSCRSRV